MKPSANRLESDLDLWEAREQRFSKMFSPAVLKSRTFQQEKLVYYQELSAKYRNPLNVDERIALKILNDEKNQLEKRLYPSLIIRLLRRAFLASVRPVLERREIIRQQNNSNTLHQQLQDLGFPQQGKRLQQMMRQGKDDFNMPVSYYNDQKERMDFDLSFKKQDNGSYQLESYKAASINTDLPLEKKEQKFNIGDDSHITVGQASNMLAGRAVLTEGTWKQLDLNDKDAAGNFRVKEFHPGYGYDLLKALQQLPIKELRNTAAKNELLTGLKNGEKLEVTLNNNGATRKLFIEANPQFKTLNITDSNGEKVSMAAALGKEIKLGQVKQLKQTMKTSKKNRVSVG